MQPATFASRGLDGVRELDRRPFLFDPDQRVTARPWYSLVRKVVADKKADTAANMNQKQNGVDKAKADADTQAASRNSDLEPLDTLRLSDLKADLSPYQLINAALNIEASKYANRRGRNADLFILRKLFTGSDANCYVDTKKMEEKMK